MKHVNVFAAVSVQGKLSVWARTEYQTKDAAIKASTVLPDAGFVYIATIPADKAIEVTIIR